MLYNLLTPWVEHFALFNLFNYITFRSFGAVMTSLLLALVLGGRIIRLVAQASKIGAAHSHGWSRHPSASQAGNAHDGWISDFALHGGEFIFVGGYSQSLHSGILCDHGGICLDWRLG